MESDLLLCLSYDSFSHISKELQVLLSLAFSWLKGPEFSQLFLMGYDLKDLSFCLFILFCQYPTENEYNIPDMVTFA